MLWLILPLVGFASGSLPFGLWIARAKGVNIRAHGSGNIGATNVWRTLGRGPGALCFTLDVLKGLLPSIGAGLTLRTLNADPASEPDVWLHMATGVAAIMGHMFTPLAGFKGGKGVATAFGALLGVWPVMTVAVLIALAAWIAVFRVGRMVGIASVIAAISMPIAVAAIGQIDPALRWRTPHLAVSIALALLVIWKHRGNIRRTLAGTEPRFVKKAPASGSSTGA